MRPSISLPLSCELTDSPRPHLPPATLLLSLSQRSLSGLTKRSATQSLVLGSADSNLLATTPLVYASEEVKHVSLSPDGARQAVFRVIPAKEGKAARKVIEVVRVTDGRKEDELDVSDAHGDWYFDGWCSSGACPRQPRTDSLCTDSDVRSAFMASLVDLARLHRRSASPQARPCRQAPRSRQVSLRARLWRDVHGQARADALPRCPRRVVVPGCTATGQARGLGAPLDLARPCRPCRLRPACLPSRH